eukprot:6208494-Pleurochrysis_carterae.AAC.1
MALARIYFWGKPERPDVVTLQVADAVLMPLTSESRRRRQRARRKGEDSAYRPAIPVPLATTGHALNGGRRVLAVLLESYAADASQACDARVACAV